MHIIDGKVKEVNWICIDCYGFLCSFYVLLVGSFSKYEKQKLQYLLTPDLYFILHLQSDQKLATLSTNLNDVINTEAMKKMVLTTTMLLGDVTVWNLFLYIIYYFRKFHYSINNIIPQTYFEDSSRQFGCNIWGHIRENFAFVCKCIYIVNHSYLQSWRQLSSEWVCGRSMIDILV